MLAGCSGGSKHASSTTTPPSTSAPTTTGASAITRAAPSIHARVPVHSAAVTRFNVHPDLALRVNVEGTAKVIALARRCGGLSSFGLCCLWPGGYYSLVLGIMATIKGSQLMGQDAHKLPPPKGTAIMMIINIINFDVVNCVLGILILVFCSDPEVEDWFRGSR